MKRQFLILSFSVFFTSFAAMGGDRAEDGNDDRFKPSPVASAASITQPRRALLDHLDSGKKKEPSSWRQVTCFGLPGSGKSTLLRALEFVVKELIPDQNGPNWINQDECGGDRRKFEAALRLAEATNTVVLADKGNHLRKHRESLARLFAQNPKDKKPLLIEFSLGISDKILLERIALRGKGHRSLQSTQVAQQVLAKWRGELDPIDGRDRRAFDVLSIHPQDPLSVNLRKIVEAYFASHPALLGRVKESPDLIERALAEAQKHEKFLERLDITPREDAPISRSKCSKKGHTRGSQGKPSANGALPTGSPSKTSPAKLSLSQKSSHLGAALLPSSSVLKGPEEKKEKEKISSSKNPFGVLDTQNDDDDDDSED